MPFSCKTLPGPGGLSEPKIPVCFPDSVTDRFCSCSVTGPRVVFTSLSGLPAPLVCCFGGMRPKRTPDMPGPGFLGPWWAASFPPFRGSPARHARSAQGLQMSVMKEQGNACLLPPRGVEAHVFLENSSVSQLGALLFHFSKMLSVFSPPHTPAPIPPHISDPDANSRK